MILLKDISYLIRDAKNIDKKVDLLIDGAYIKRIGRIDPKDLSEDTVIIHCRNKVVIPGLINSHTHLWQTLLRGRKDNLPLISWCNEVLSPLIQSLSKKKDSIEVKELSYLWSMLGSIEMIRGGITSFFNMDIGFSSTQIIRAWQDIGIRGTLGIEMADKWLPDDAVKNMDKEKEDIIALIESCHNTPIALAPSAPFICSESLLGWASDQAEKYNLSLQIHISETSREVEESIRQKGKPPLEYLDSLGFLSRPVSAVHCVHLTESEFELARYRSVIPIYNPKSNMKLGSGIAPVGKMLKAGLEVALGTDGPASNDIIDMFEEMRMGVMLQRAAERDVSALSSSDIFHMATKAGAECCSNNAGIINENRIADVVILDTSSVHTFSTGGNILSWLIFCAKSSDVESVIINGSLVMKDHIISGIDEQLILSEIRRIVKLF